MHSTQDSGADAAALARAYTIARDSADLRTLWAQIQALDGRIKTDDQYDALLDTSRYLTHYTLWLLEHRREYAEVGTSVTRLQPAIHEVRSFSRPSRSEGAGSRSVIWHAAGATAIAQGVPTKLAEKPGGARAAACGIDLVQLAAKAACRCAKAAHRRARTLWIERPSRIGLVAWRH